MSEANDRLEDVKITLENEGNFYSWCKAFLRGTSFSRFKEVIVSRYHPARELNDVQSDYLRRYFRWRWLTDQKSPEPTMEVPSVPSAAVIIPDSPRSPPPSLSEFRTMSSTLTFKQQFLLNGADVSTTPVNNIYAIISAEENRIKDLEKIENKPKSLITQIEEAKATLKALVAHLDAK